MTSNPSLPKIGGDTLNRSSFILIYALLGVGGSLYSIAVFGAVAFCAAKMMAGRLAGTNDPMPMGMAAAGLFYFLSGAVMLVADPDGAGNRSLIIERLPFLGILPLFLQLRLSDSRAILRYMATGAIVGTIGLAIWVAGEVILGTSSLRDFRAEGPAGNSGPLATASAFLFAMNLLTALHESGTRRWMGAFCTVLAALIVGMSGMRSMLPVLLLVPCVYLVLLPDARKRLTSRRSLIILAVGLAAFALISGPVVIGRAEQLLAMFGTSGLEPSAHYSLGQRIAMWHCALEVFRDAPLLGLGRAEAQAFLEPCTQELVGRPLAYTHYHNAVFTALAFGGLLELCAVALMFAVPLYWVWKRRGDAYAVPGRALIVATLLIFGLTGMFNIMLDHDIHDALFIHATTSAVAMMSIGPGRAGHAHRGSTP